MSLGGVPTEGDGGFVLDQEHDLLVHGARYDPIADLLL
jgi:hypothetical protein